MTESQVIINNVLIIFDIITWCLDHAVLETKFTHVHEHDFIKSRFRGVGKTHALQGWLVSVYIYIYM